MNTEDQLKAQSLAVSTVALKVLGIRTLELQNSDRLDFHDLSVETIRLALNAAYEAGLAQNQKK
jgi:hypothetical protein